MGAEIELDLKTEKAGAAPAYRSNSLGRIFVRKLLRKGSARVGLSIIFLLLFCAIFGPLIIPYDPFAIDVDGRLEAPSAEHLFGTDELGRDLFSRVIYGARYTVIIMLLTTSIAAIGGVGLSLPSAFFGGKWDMLIMRLIDVMMGFPYILLILAIVAILGPSLTNSLIAIAIASIPGFARLARSSILVIKEQDFVSAERALGASSLRIMLHTILPNILSPIIVMVTLAMPSAALSAAALSFLGLGAQPPLPEWGTMMVNARDYVLTASWIVMAPGLAIFLTVFGVNLFGNALRDVMDPRDKTFRH